jgi:hypothetical protein
LKKKFFFFRLIYLRFLKFCFSSASDFSATNS